MSVSEFEPGGVTPTPASRSARRLTSPRGGGIKSLSGPNYSGR